MKKLALFSLFIVVSIQILSAQINQKLEKSKVITTSGLKLEIRISKSVIVKETADPADMFFFKVFEVRDGASSSPSAFACNSQLTEITGFQVNSKVNLYKLSNGDIAYNFVIPGLKTGQKYGIDVFPVNNRLSAPNGLTLSKSGYTSNGYCNPSVIDGAAIRINFGTFSPPK